jgi:cell wall-associated NlpC family hydrolase
MTPEAKTALLHQASVALDGLPTEEIQERLRVVDEALRWLGTPFHHMARVQGAGVDCAQLLAGTFEGAGLVTSILTPDYPRDWMRHRDEERFVAIVEEYAKPIERAALPGDIALFKFGRCISHGAIVVTWPMIVHAFVRVGVTLDDVDKNHGLATRFAGVWSAWEVTRGR